MSLIWHYSLSIKLTHATSPKIAKMNYSQREITRRTARITRTFLNLYSNIEHLNKHITQTNNRTYMRNITNSIQESVRGLDIDQQLFIKQLYNGSDHDLYQALSYLNFANNLLSIYDNKLRFLANELGIFLPETLHD